MDGKTKVRKKEKGKGQKGRRWWLLLPFAFLLFPFSFI
jgi:hypothetical protein